MKYSTKKFNIRYTANFFSKHKNNEIRIWFAVPTNSKFQKIEKIKVLLKPYSSYNDKQKNKILYFKFFGKGNFTISIDLNVNSSRQKFNLYKKSHLILKTLPHSIKKYVKSEKFLEQIPNLRAITINLTKNKETYTEKIQAIFEFIMKNFKYCYPVKKRGVKHLNLENLKGDCGEYSSLFVTMCRILGIPARNQTGFVIFPKQKKIAEHGWASVYFKNYGWIDFDPQYASLEKSKNSALKKYFGQRSDYRIVFINGFNIPLKPEIPINFNLNFWKKVYLPISNNSTQILQPLVFTSKEKVILKEKIEILN